MSKYKMVQLIFNYHEFHMKFGLCAPKFDEGLAAPALVEVLATIFEEEGLPIP